jgi:small subunit ribosomal protein S18
MTDEKNLNELDQEGYLKISLLNQGMTNRRRRNCPLKDVPIEKINYKNIKLLGKYISERGKIIPSRISGVCMKKQRKLSQAIKRARILALLSFIDKAEEK